MEPDYAQREMLVDTLQEAGYTVIARKSFEEVLARSRAELLGVDLILADIDERSPLGGITNIQKLKRICGNNLPVVGMGTLQETERFNQERALTVVNAFVEKPFDLNKLMTVIARQLTSEQSI